MDQYGSEQEQIEQLKRWWKENGRSLVFGLVIGIGGLAGYRYWDAARTVEAQNASIVYEQFLDLITRDQIEQARDTGKGLVSSYPDSTYARLTALMLAKLAVDNGDADGAKALLRGLLESAAGSEIEAVVRARLARILLAERDVAGAADLLAAIPETGDTERFAELRGDVLAAGGDVDGARTMYLKALAQAETLGLERGAIQLKLDNLPAVLTVPADAGDS